MNGQSKPFEPSATVLLIYLYEWMGALLLSCVALSTYLGAKLIADEQTVLNLYHPDNVIVQHLLLLLGIGLRVRLLRGGRRYQSVLRLLLLLLP